MDLQYTTFWNWKIKIFIDVNLLERYQKDLDIIVKDDRYTFYFLERSRITSLFKHDIFNNISFRKLNRTYKRSKILKDHYRQIVDFCKKENIKIAVFTSTGQYRHPDFLKQLKNLGMTITLTTADDDTSRINYCSLPYTKYYDYHFHVGVMYDKHWTTIADVLKKHGGNPLWLPLWARSNHINDAFSYTDRDIEVCYIGNVNPPKLWRLSRLKHHFGDRFKLYGAQWNGDRKSLKGIFYKITNKVFWLWYVQKLTDTELLDVYRRTKIGFNMHLVPRKWPSNSRLYELPLNGVMQLCDNKLWLPKVFEIDKEIIYYSSISDAINKIEYYLAHEDERIAIAKAWYERAKDNYEYFYSLSAIFKKITA